MREMGFTRGIIRRGFRSSDQSVPHLSQVDIQRLMSDPSPDDDLVNLSGNAKKAKYAWLLEGEPPSAKRPRKKRKSGGQTEEPLLQNGDGQGSLESMENPIENGVMSSQYPIPVGQQHLPPTISHDGYVPSYISPYRHVTADGGMMVRHAGENQSQMTDTGMMPVVSGPLHATMRSAARD